MAKNKPQQQESNMTIELPADAVEILSNGKNAYIHMDGTVYRVIEESKYWEAISTERQRVIEEVKELVEGMKWGDELDDKYGGERVRRMVHNQTLDDLLSALKEMEGAK